MITLEKLKEFGGFHRGPDPFTIGEYSYATDGHVMLRVPRMSGVSEEVPYEPFKRSPEVFVSSFQDYSFLPFSIDLPPQAIEILDCDECHGEGHGHHHCPTCDCQCEECGGSGKVENNSDTGICVGPIGGNYFQARFIRKILTLPDIKLCPGTKPVLTSTHSMSFSFDGGYGVLMSLTKPSDHVIRLKFQEAA